MCAIEGECFVLYRLIFRDFCLHVIYILVLRMPEKIEREAYGAWYELVTAHVLLISTIYTAMCQEFIHHNAK